MKTNALVVYKNSLLLYKDVIEIHHTGLIWTADYYNEVENYVVKYLQQEGFLETIDLKNPEVCDNLLHVPRDIRIFDGTGKHITKEQLI